MVNLCCCCDPVVTDALNSGAGVVQESGTWTVGPIGVSTSSAGALLYWTGVSTNAPGKVTGITGIQWSVEIASITGKPRIYLLYHDNPGGNDQYLVAEITSGSITIKEDTGTGSESTVATLTGPSSFPASFRLLLCLIDPDASTWTWRLTVLDSDYSQIDQDDFDSAVSVGSDTFLNSTIPKIGNTDAGLSDFRDVKVSNGYAEDDPFERNKLCPECPPLPVVTICEACDTADPNPGQQYEITVQNFTGRGDVTVVLDAHYTGSSCGRDSLPPLTPGTPLHELLFSDLFGMPKGLYVWWDSGTFTHLASIPFAVDEFTDCSSIDITYNNADMTFSPFYTQTGSESVRLRSL